MSEMEDKLSAIMNDPQMMQQIFSMAQSMTGASASGEEPMQESFPELDMGMLQKISGLAQQSSIDRREQSLLQALSAYLSGDRIRRLERAMRAARMAKTASAFLGQQGLLPNGR